jgi:hypothetical protein
MDLFLTFLLTAAREACKDSCAQYVASITRRADQITLRRDDWSSGIMRLPPLQVELEVGILGVRLEMTSGAWYRIYILDPFSSDR